MSNKLNNLKTMLSGRIFMVAGWESATNEAVEKISSIIEARIVEVLNFTFKVASYLGERHITGKYLYFFTGEEPSSEILVYDQVLINSKIKKQFKIFSTTRNHLLVDPYAFAHLVHHIGSNISITARTYDIGFIIGLLIEVQNHAVKIIDKLSLPETSSSALPLQFIDIQFGLKLHEILPENPLVIRNIVNFSTDIKRFLDSSARVLGRSTTMDSNLYTYIGQFLCNIIYFTVEKSLLFMTLDSGRDIIDLDLIMLCIKCYFSEFFKNGLCDELIRSVDEKTREYKVKGKVDDNFDRFKSHFISYSKVYKQMKLNSGRSRITTDATLALTQFCDSIIFWIIVELFGNQSNTSNLGLSEIETVFSCNDKLMKIGKTVRFLCNGDNIDHLTNSFYTYYTFSFFKDNISYNYYNDVNDPYLKINKYEHHNRRIVFTDEETNEILNPVFEENRRVYVNEKTANDFLIADYIFNEPNYKKLNFKGLTDPFVNYGTPHFVEVMVRNRLKNIKYI